MNYCWLSLEGGLLYAFVGPAAAVVLVNMGIGILVFNKLVSKDGITDKKLKERAGEAGPHCRLLVWHLYFAPHQIGVSEASVCICFSLLISLAASCPRPPSGVPSRVLSVEPPLRPLPLKPPVTPC
ncbi:hypothetical protein MC885_003150 [Smutsia gigantea]|nr:hypothetical protein MC885_003150 [Smutsia gigantea]